MKLFSLKPKNKKEDIKNYETYKEAFDFCFDTENDINNIGVIGDYGTGKSTIIETYVSNEINEKNYDILRVSILTLKNNNTNSLVLLKNIIKQIVQNPKKKLEHNILKFKNYTFNWLFILVSLLCLFLFLFVFFTNQKFSLHIPFINKSLHWELSIGIYSTIKYFLLAFIVIGFVAYIYPKLFSGFKFSKLSFSSKFEGELEKSTDNISNVEFDYLEYLIYLLRRKKKKDLLLIIEDIDRYENIDIFEQLREVNNLLNSSDNQHTYKFIYAVGNSIFSDTLDKNISNIRTMYESKFKENVSKFFDFTLNIIPTMDSQNSYEFIKLNYPKILGDNLINDEELFMTSQYIDSPRILIDIMNDYHIMEKNVTYEKKEHLKILYYSILKSKFYNFYDLIHDIFEDLKNIINNYNNIDVYEESETRREEEFLSNASYFSAIEIEKSGRNLNYASISSLRTVWNSIKDTPDITAIKEQHGNIIICHSTYSSDPIRLDVILNAFESKNKDVVFSSIDYRQSIILEMKSVSKKSSEILKMYYNQNNVTFIEVMKNVERERIKNPNKRDFYITDFLDIDFVKLGIIEEIINVNDYNTYISSEYLAINDSMFIKSFNLNETNQQLLKLQLKDYKSIISKMKLDKIIDNNGLNIHLIEWIINLEDIERNDKMNKIVKNSINSLNFVEVFLFEKFDGVKFSLNKYLNIFHEDLESVQSFKKILEFFSDSNHRNENKISEYDVERIISQTSIKKQINLRDSSFEEEWFYELLIKYDVLYMEDEESLLILFQKISDRFINLLNLVLDKYSELIIKDSKGHLINFFNKEIQTFSRELGTPNVDLITTAYTNADNKVKVETLTSVYNEELKYFLYNNKYFEYTIENINTIREMMCDGIDPVPYIDYTEREYKLFFEYVEKYVEFNIQIENDWDKKLLFRLFDNLEINELNNILNIIKNHSPIQVNISEMVEQDINLNNLSEIFTNVRLYKNDYSNYKDIFDFIHNLEKPEYKSVLSDILKNPDFDFNLLFKEIDTIKNNSDIKKLLYDNLLDLTEIDLNIFEKYIVEYDELFQIDSLTISQPKLKILFKNNKLESSYTNINFCEKNLLIDLFEDKSLSFSAQLSRLSISDILLIINKLGSDTFKYLVKILEHLNNDEKSIELIMTYLNDIEFEDTTLALNIFSSLLESVSFENKDILKVKELLRNRRKGERTISSNNNQIIEFLRERGGLTVKNTSNSENIKLVYKTNKQKKS